MAVVFPTATDLGIAPATVMSSATQFEATGYVQAQQQQTPPSQGHTPQGNPPPPPPLPATNHQLSQTQAQYHQPHQTQLPPAQQQQQTAPQSRSVKRPRPVKSCTECRKRKLRCDRLCPCSQCQKSSRMCKYAADNDSSNLSDASDGESTDVAPRPAKRNCAPAVNATGSVSDGLYTQVRNHDGSAIPLLEELVGRIDRLEKHLVRPSPATTTDTGFEKWGPIEISPSTVRGLSVKNGGQRTRLWGPASPRVIVTLFDEARGFMRDHNRNPDTKEVFASFRKLHKLLRTEFQRSLTPITVYVDSMMPIQKRMADILPKKHVCDRLIRGYLDNNETLYRVLHAPTFLAEYNSYWDGTLQSEAFLPKLLGVLSIASRFDTKSRGLGHERSEGVHLPTASALIRLWLNNLRGKQLIALESVQIELLWLLTMRMIKEHARDGWSHLGQIMRMAMSMGLHRDPSEFGTRITPFIAEMRRRVWATIADLDFYVSNDCNLPSLLREEDSTTGPPRNLDDADLHPHMKELPPAKPFDQVTDNHVQAFAAMTFGLRKRAARLIARIDTIKDWSEIEDVTSRLEKHIDEMDHIFPRHPPVGDARKARLWRCRGLLDAHVRHPLLHLYRPFVLGVPNVPPQFLRAYLGHSVNIVKAIEELDPSMPDYEAVVEITHVGVKGDAIQAVLSLCYFIRAALRPNTTDPALISAARALRMSPEVDGHTSSSYQPEGAMWSTSRLISIVEKVLEFLIQNIKRGDTKDIICLSVVLESVRNPEPRAEEMAHGLRVVLDQCLRAANCSLERLASAPPEPVQQGADAYGLAGPVPTYPPPGSLMNALADQDGWMFWDGWD